MSSLGRRTSGDFATAFESALDGAGDDFLTRDELTIDHIHSLSTGSPLNSFHQKNPALALHTDLPVDLNDYDTLVSPNSEPLGDRFSESHNKEAKESSATKPKTARGVPRVANLAKPAPKKVDSATPSKRDSSRISPASTKAMSPSGRPAVSSRTNSATMSRIPSSPGAAGHLSPPSRSTSVSSARNTVGSPVGSVSRTGSMTSRVPSGSARPTSPGGNIAHGTGRLNGTVSTTSRPGSGASKGALSPTGVAPRTGSSSRIPRPGGSVGPSPDGKPGVNSISSSRTLAGEKIASPSPTANGATATRSGSFTRGPSGKYAGASSTKAPARKALEDIMSELQDVKHQLGLPVSGSRRSSTANEVLPKEELLVSTRKNSPTRTAVAAEITNKSTIESAAPETAHAPGQQPPSEVETSVVFNISIAEQNAVAEAPEGSIEHKGGEAEEVADDSIVAVANNQDATDAELELQNANEEKEASAEAEAVAETGATVDRKEEDEYVIETAEEEEKHQTQAEAEQVSDRQLGDTEREVPCEEKCTIEKLEIKAAEKTDAVVIEAKEVPADATSKGAEVPKGPEESSRMDVDAKESTTKCACCVVM